MKVIRLLGVAVVLTSVFASCAPKYGCYGMTDATEISNEELPVVAFEVCLD